MINRIGFFLLLMFAWQTCHCQNNSHKIDSLNELLGGTQSDSARFKTLCSLGYAYIDLDNKMALSYGNHVYLEAKRFKNNFQVIEAGQLLGSALRRLGKLDSALVIYSEIIALAKKMNVSYYRILRTKAWTHTLNSQYDKALTHYFDAMKFGNATWLDSARYFNNIGLIYYKMKNYDKAILFYEDGFELYKKNDDKCYAERLLINLSLCYAYKADFLKAKACLDQALEICEGDWSEGLMKEYLFAYGIILYGQQDFHEAERKFFESYRLSVKGDDNRYLVENVIFLVRIYLKQKKLSKALKYLMLAEEIDKGTGYGLLKIEICKLFAAFYNELKDYENVSKYQQCYIILRDSIYDEELTKNLMVIQAEQEQILNNAKIKSQVRILALKQQIIDGQVITNVVIVIAAILLLLFLVVLYWDNVQRRNVSKQLEQKVKDRTSLLQENFIKLQTSYKEQELFMIKISMEINASLMTLKGFGNLILSDVPNIQVDIDKVEYQWKKCEKELKCFCE